MILVLQVLVSAIIKYNACVVAIFGVIQLLPHEGLLVVTKNGRHLMQTNLTVASTYVRAPTV